jgi:recombination protein RecT
MTEEQTAVATQAPTYESRMVAFKGAWEKALPVVRQLLPSHVTPERIFSIAVTARQRNPKLLECSDISVLRGIIVGAQLGLDVSGVGGKAYLVPFFNKNTRQLEAQFMPGYRGLVELARRTGQIGAIYGRVVYAKDDFEYQEGLMQVLRHVPYMGADDAGPVVGVWVVAVWTNGYRQPEVLSKLQIDRIRASSKASDGEAWTNWYDEMALKSALKRLCKKLPDSVELARVLDIEDHMDIGEPPAIDIPLVEETEPKPTRTEAIKAEIKARAPEPPPTLEPPVKRGPGRPPKPKPVEVVPPTAPEGASEDDDEKLPPPDLDDEYDAG